MFHVVFQYRLLLLCQVHFKKLAPASDPVSASTMLMSYTDLTQPNNPDNPSLPVVVWISVARQHLYAYLLQIGVIHQPGK